MDPQLADFTDLLSDDEIENSQPLSLSFEYNALPNNNSTECLKLNTKDNENPALKEPRPAKGTGQYGQFRSVEEIDQKYRSVFSYPFFNVVQSSVIDDALYTDKSIVVSAPTGSGKTVVFEMAIVQLLMAMDDNNSTGNFKIIYMAPVKALCTERLTEWYPKFTKLGLHCIEVTGDTDVDFSQLTPYRIIITTPEKWDMLTRRWRDYRQLVEQIKLFLIDEVHILNDANRGPVLEAVVSRMKTIESSAQSAHRIEQLQKQYRGEGTSKEPPPKIRFVAVSATVGNPEDVAKWLGNEKIPAVYYTFGDESRPVKLKRIVEGYHCSEGSSIFKFDIFLNYKLWPIIQKYYNGKPTLIFCNTRKSVLLTAEMLSKEITVSFGPEQKAKLTALASTFKNKKLQSLILSGVGCHHAGLLFEERTNVEFAFRNRDLPILITTTTLAMGVNLPAHLVIIKNTQQYVNGAYQEYSISTVLQMVGRAGRPQYDTEATAVIMTRLCDKGRYQALVGGVEPLQSYLHKRLAENLNSEAALGTVGDVAQCVQWLRSTFLFVRAARDPKRYLGLPQAAPQNQISKKIEELCVKAMNGLATSGLIKMDEASCIESTEAGRLMSIYYLDLETMKHIMKVNGSETLEQLLWVVCESHELADMHLRMDERKYLNALNRNNNSATIRFPMKGKISTRQMKVNCIIQAILGCLPISDPSLNQEAMRIIRIADRVCRCLFAYVTQSTLISTKPKYYSAVLNSAILLKCVLAHLWENSQFVSKQLRGIGPTFSTLLASAGKVNFMLLEESHPRDLERIMNKGPPAGNILRKQTSLLPKYQLTMTPIDEKLVTLQLDLLNCSYLLENIDSLTAGSTHKSYIIVGDSENHLLHFNSFNDNSLISVYNGTITFQISRMHSFEHKIFAHCISSTFVGIDANCNYIFKDLEPQPRLAVVEMKRPTQKQTVITNTYKERKRKSNNNNDLTQSKEKKKRESILIDNFKNLKESFGRTSKELKDDLEKTAVISNQILEGFHQLNEPMLVDNTNPAESSNNQNNSNVTNEILVPQEVFEDSNDEFMDDDYKIYDILNEIENEISEKQSNVTLTNKRNPQNRTPKVGSNNISQFKRSNILQAKCTKNNMPPKSNYNFIDLLEKNIDLDDDLKDEHKQVSSSSGFSDRIKGLVNVFLNKIQNVDITADKQLKELIEEGGIIGGKRNSTEINQLSTGIEVTNINNTEVNNFNKLEEVLQKTELDDENVVTLLSPPGPIEIVQTIPVEIPHNNKECIDNSNCKIVENEYSHTQYNCNNDELIGLPDVDINVQNENQLQTTAIKEKATKDTVISNTIRKGEEIAEKVQFSEKDEPNNATDVSNMNVKCSVVDVNDRKKTNSTTKKKLTSNQNIVATSQNDPSLQNFNSEISLVTEDPSLVSEFNDGEFNELVPAISFDSEIQKISFQEKLPHHNSTKLCDNFNTNIRNIVNGNRDKSERNNFNQYVKKYSFSAGHTNVITKVIDDSIVRITRKLQLNLDVTDTIRTVNKQSSKIHKNVVLSDQLEENYSDFDALNTGETSKYVGNITPYKENYSELSLSHLPKRPREMELADPELTILNHLPGTSLNNNEHKSIVSFKKPEENFIQDEDHISVDYVSGNEIVKTLPMSSRTNNERNNITSILQKYSEKMRKKNTPEENNHTVCQNVKPISYSIEAAKLKRPFKISEIDKLNSKLPDFLIQPSNSDSSSHKHIIDSGEVKTVVTPKITRALEYPTSNKCETLSIQPVPIRYSIKEHEDKIDYPFPNIFNILPLQIEDKDPINKHEQNMVTPLETDLFPQNDELDDVNSNEFNIDPNMFNPKALLQCFSKEEPANVLPSLEILPPPPEFCDTYNITNNYEYEGNLSTDSYDPVKWQNNLDDDIHNIFQSDSNIDLTPTKEIETWTLSQDSAIVNSSLGIQSARPYLVNTTQHNTQDYLQYRTTTMNRHARLGQFRFTRKRKLQL